jgi:glycosyltransferase involved in cell wall biosynthesis
MTDKNIKSVHITNYYHKNSGGISTAYDRLLEAANRHRRYVRLIVPGAADAQEEVGEFGRIYYVKAKPAPVFDKRYRLLLPFDYLPGDSPVRKILEAELPDIIEIGEKYTLSLLAGVLRKGRFPQLNRPMLVHFSCERMDDNLRAFVSSAKPFRWFSRRLIGNYIHPMFDFHLANSEYTAQEVKDAVSVEKNPHRSKMFFDFCHRFFRASNVQTGERVFVNQCGADTHLFSVKRKNSETRQRILTEAGFPENATVLLYAGRLSPEKNVKFLPEVLRSLLEFHNFDWQKRDYRLLIAGDGPLKNELEENLQTIAPGKFKFLGHITDHEKLADIYANSDIFLHPNPREPFGIGPLEAMASGLPVVAPDSGGVLSYATDENAWLSETETEGYFSAVRDVFNDDEKRTRKIKNALETAAKYSWENSTDNLFALYDKMYRDFRRRRKLFINEPEVKTPDFVEQIVLSKEKPRKVE